MKAQSAMIITILFAAASGLGQIRDTFIGSWRSKNPSEDALVQFERSRIILSHGGTNQIFVVKDGTDLVMGLTVQSNGQTLKAKASYKFDEMFLDLGEKKYFIKKQQTHDAAASPIIGKLGKPVGTELTIEGTFQAGKGDWLLVSKVNQNRLTTSVLMPTENLDPSTQIPTNTVCRFKGKEIIYVVQPDFDPATGRERQQASSGRHFYFQVTKVLVPKGVKIRDER